MGMLLVVGNGTPERLATDVAGGWHRIPARDPARDLDQGPRTLGPGPGHGPGTQDLGTRPRDPGPWDPARDPGPWDPGPWDLDQGPRTLGPGPGTQDLRTRTRDPWPWDPGPWDPD